MNIKFNNSLIEQLIMDLLDISNNKKIILKYVDSEIARMIKKRIDYFGAAPNFYWCIINPIGHFEALSGDFMHKYSIRLNQNYRLIIRPDLNNFSMEELKKCESYYIEGVVDYYGSKKNWIIP